MFSTIWNKFELKTIGLLVSVALEVFFFHAPGCCQVSNKVNGILD